MGKMIAFLFINSFVVQCFGMAGNAVETNHVSETTTIEITGIVEVDYTANNIDTTFLPIIDFDKIWVKQQEFQGQSPGTRQYVFTSPEVLIDGKIYYEHISTIIFGEDNINIGFYREEDGKLIKKVGQTEVVILDMALQVGDSLSLNNDEVMVTEVDNVVTDDGITRKRLFMSCDVSDPDARVYEVIEGIGFIFEYSDDCSQLIDTPLSLVCLKNSSETVFVNDAFDGCIEFVDVDKIFDKSIVIFPTLVQNAFTIEAGGLKNLRVAVIDAVGQVHHSSEIDSGARINVAGWTDGVYFVTITLDSRVLRKQKLVIQQ